ncbi:MULTISPECIES: DNA-deoxyinosine glycosylase [Virgibacillus]|uniref:DNA-deoxyinosine glycosylase n=1 Tax=Virgibacillus dokdonensis TaxID=302167 RepID=A0A2K9J1P7_9BACI|nr:MULTISPECIES: DNA-deoxyinosine glycosylase [Virgibacillus]AUJ25644.1 Uracil DNA glycosylase superfamily protein [Virgibacillus dokdonensis]NWO12144.1 DNA-deoxyinosine glycosylase [Virgibacillus sp.]
MEKLSSFQPVLPKDPKVLILGSMPGKQSLQRQEYYGNPRNQFWDILLTILQEPKVIDYTQKLQVCKKHCLALWDTVGTCYRAGSLDANIKDETPNDIPSLLHKYPSIKLIACNGGKSYQLLNKYFKQEHLAQVDVVKLPSTSPIPGKYTKRFVDKVEAWKVILKYI